MFRLAVSSFDTDSIPSFETRGALPELNVQKAIHAVLPMENPWPRDGLRFLTLCKCFTMLNFWEFFMLANFLLIRMGAPLRADGLPPEGGQGCPLS